MERKGIIRIHIIASIISFSTILIFFSMSLFAEINGNEGLIKNVKRNILVGLPLMIITMPALAITGKKLAGKSQNILILIKQKRMKFILANGILLILLAGFLYYYSHYIALNTTFLIFQLLEFFCGLANLTMIGMNIKDGIQLSHKRE
ncbi:hypothetical protein [Chryseobacterium sp.]|uniref:hypothetical protein n=1 Tax=Chryseobacterium sp. TaxID=1871047 RepID=UPI0025BBC863|nr:hypothetical protein [Chryseobacterium sp.]